MDFHRRPIKSPGGLLIISGSADSTTTRLICDWLQDQKAGIVAPKGCTTLAYFADNDIQAAVAFHNFTPKSVELTYSLVKLNRPFIKACFDYAFNQLDKECIWGYASHENAKALNLLIHSGATLQAELKSPCGTEIRLVYRYDRVNSKLFKRLQNG